MSAPSPAATAERPEAAVRAGQALRTVGRIRAEHVRDYGILAVLVAIFVTLSILSPVFLTERNLLNLVFANATVGIPACAVTYVIIAGNFDLSIGAVFALCETLAAWGAVHLDVWAAFPIALVAGGVLGLFNGVLVTKLRVNSFLATLASALAFSGIALGITGGFEITPTSSVFTFLGQQKLGPIQYPDLIFLVVAVATGIVLAFTVFGRQMYAVGGNREAARLSGIKVDRVVVVTFVITGIGAGIAGLIDASTTGSGSSAGGTSLALSAIAGVALGGTSIFGGSGAIWRTVVGVLMLGMITNGFDILGVATFWQEIVEGALIVGAVAIGSMVQRR